MFTRYKRYILIATVASLAIAPLVFFSSPLKPWTNTSLLTLVWQEVIYPFEYAWHKSTTTVGELWNTYVDLTETEKENADLRSQLAMQKARIMDYQDQLQEKYSEGGTPCLPTGPLPYHPGREPHENVEQGPDRPENPVGRIPRRLGQLGVPHARHPA